MKLSKRFLKCGWAPMPSGDLSRGKGSATDCFLFTGPNRYGTWRIVSGKRISRIESRRHGTPTGRCSRGRWIVEWKGDTPSGLREWGTFGDFAAWLIGVSPEEREGYTWTGNLKNDMNRCRTKATAGRGRKIKGMPGYTLTAGYAPASGRKAATHSPTKINRARVARERRAKNLEWLNEMNARDAKIKANRDARISARLVASGLFKG